MSDSDLDVSGLLSELDELLLELEKHESTNALDHYDPYPYQILFHNDKEKFRCLRAGNRIGKTHCGGAEIAYHATGLYPEWWEGHRFDRPLKIVAAGKNNEKTRDLIQNSLFGDPTSSDAWGTGWIPKALIGEAMRKPGVPEAKYHIHIKHISGGWSKITLLAYDMPKETWMGHKADINWLDEEPPEQIMSQAIRSVIDTGGIILMTFTPENGTTGVVKLVEEAGSSWSLHKAGWKDVSGSDFFLDLDKDRIHFDIQYRKSGTAGHLTEEKITNAIKAMMPHEVKMRAEGLPLLGTGLVFPYPESDIDYDSFEIPDHWPRIAGIDFGYTHYTAIVWLAIDIESDSAFLYDAIRINKREINEIAPFILSRPSSWVPVAWPHDGNKNFGMGGSIQKQYRDYGINLLEDHFTNPPKDNQIEGKGGIQIMPGIVEMANRFNDGRLKVASHLFEWFEEFRNYHHKNNKIIDRDDDLMAATRYAVQSIRFAQVEKTTAIYKSRDVHSDGWMSQ